MLPHHPSNKVLPHHPSNMQCHGQEACEVPSLAATGGSVRYSGEVRKKSSPFIEWDTRMRYTQQPWLCAGCISSSNLSKIRQGLYRFMALPLHVTTGGRTYLRLSLLSMKLYCLQAMALHFTRLMDKALALYVSDKKASDPPTNPVKCSAIAGHLW